MIIIVRHYINSVNCIEAILELNILLGQVRLEKTAFVHEAFESKLRVDVVFTDFSMAFDTIDHGSLIYVLDRLGFGEPLGLSLVCVFVPSQFIDIFGTSSIRF